MRLSRRILTTLGISVALVLTLAVTPAQASAYAFSACASPTGYSPDNCLQWTGGYPGGYVRAWVPARYYYEVRLDTCAGVSQICDTSPWRTVQDKVLNRQAGYTLSYATTRYGWFRLCVKQQAGGGWGCSADTGDYTIAWPLYLGD